MKYCRILSLKSIPNHLIENHKNNFIQYTNQLQKEAQKQPGFVATESFWIQDVQRTFPEKTAVLTISTWETIHNWSSWFESSKRNNIHKQFKFIEKEEKFYQLKLCKNNDNFFLL